MEKSQKDMCPFAYWRAREGNSEIHRSGVVNFIKVRRQKDICMGKSQKNICPFSYWRARVANSESTGVVNFIKVQRQKKVICRRASSIMILISLAAKRVVQKMLVIVLFLCRICTPGVPVMTSCMFFIWGFTSL